MDVCVCMCTPNTNNNFLPLIYSHIMFIILVSSSGDTCYFILPMCLDALQHPHIFTNVCMQLLT